MRDYTDKVDYSIRDEKGKPELHIWSRDWSFSRTIGFSSMKALKNGLENELALFISDTKELFPKREEPKETATNDVALY